MTKRNKVIMAPLAITMLLLSACQTDPGSSSQNELSENSLSTGSLVESGSVDNSSSPTIQHTPVTYYTSPDGKVDNPGTEDAPIEILAGLARLQAGDTFIFKNGTYKTNMRLLVEPGRDGTKDAPITLKAETPGKVLLDFSSMDFTTLNRGIAINSNYWVIDSLKVKGAGDNGIYIGGSHNLVKDCEVYQCRDTGIQLGRANSLQQKIHEWPSYNTILNCTSHDNADPTGEDADGFACKLTTGIGNVFKGCIAYNNIDDGWDLYTKADSGAIGAVLLEDCIAFNNGVRSDGFGLESTDGNGFKLGGESIAVQHVVRNCMAFNNLAHGFTDNSNPGTIRIENCTSFNNSIRDPDCNNIDMCREKDMSNGNYFKNILSYSTGDYACTPQKKPENTDEQYQQYEKEMTNSRDQYYGSASHCVFYNGLTTLKIEGVEKCDYDTEQYRGVPFVPTTSPFVSEKLPEVLSIKDYTDETDTFNYLRDENRNIVLGDFLKINPESEFFTMGEGGKPLGADLSGNK